MQSFNQ